MARKSIVSIPTFTVCCLALLYCVLWTSRHAEAESLASTAHPFENPEAERLPHSFLDSSNQPHPSSSTGKPHSDGRAPSASDKPAGAEKSEARLLQEHKENKPSASSQTAEGLKEEAHKVPTALPGSRDLGAESTSTTKGPGAPGTEASHKASEPASSTHAPNFRILASSTHAPNFRILASSTLSPGFRVLESSSNASGKPASTTASPHGSAASEAFSPEQSTKLASDPQNSNDDRREAGQPEDAISNAKQKVDNFKKDVKDSVHNAPARNLHHGHGGCSCNGKSHGLRGCPCVQPVIPSKGQVVVPSKGKQSVSAYIPATIVTTASSKSRPVYAAPSKGSSLYLSSKHY